MSFDPKKLLEGNMVKGGKDFKFSDNEEYIGIYFSAHWCPPCRGFTPALAKFYEQVNTGGNVKFEIVFVSSDRNQTSFDEYFAEMPWAALKYECRDKKEAFAGNYSVRGIPTLIILNKDGTVFKENGRECVGQKIQSETWDLKF